MSATQFCTEVLVAALRDAATELHRINADIADRHYRAEELKEADAWEGIDTPRYDGSWAALFNQIDEALGLA